MNRIKTFFRPLAWMLVTGLIAAAVLTGCNNSSSSAPPALALLAGSMGGDGSTDGTGKVAKFKNPSAVTIDSAGNMYVADNKNCTIRKSPLRAW